MTKEKLEVLRDLLQLTVYVFALGAVIAVSLTAAVVMTTAFVDKFPCQKSARPIARLV